MRVMAGRMVFSATDLMRFMGCADVTTLDLAHLRGRVPNPAPTARMPPCCSVTAMRMSSGIWP